MHVLTREEIEFCRDMIKREMPERKNFLLKSPTLSFSNKKEVNFGNLTCITERIVGVYATDTSIVYIAEKKVMFLIEGRCVFIIYNKKMDCIDLNKTVKEVITIGLVKPVADIDY